MKSKVFKKSLKVRSGGRKWSEAEILAHSKKRVADLRRKGAKYRAIDNAITRHILKSSKPPPGWGHRKIGKLQDAGTKEGLKLDKKLGGKIPWLFLAITGIIIVIVYLIFIRRLPDNKLEPEDFGKFVDDEDFKP